jgi:glycosyltransferase involved in cell wall biosynthesis
MKARTTTKTVSVIIPVFNGQATIAAAIDSALAQEFEGEVEVIVVNDGSTDATSNVLDAYRGRVKVLDRVNGGPAGARNVGVRVSHGEYIAFLDADDIWTPGKLAKTVTVLEREPDVAMVYTNALIIDAAGNRLGTTYTPADQKRAPSMEDMLSVAWNILPSTMVMRRATFETIGGFPEEFATGHMQWEDTYFTIVAREQAPFAYLDEPTVLYCTPGSVAENLKRRRVLKQNPENSKTMPLDRYVRSGELMERLVRDRFGDRASRLIDAVRRATARLLVSVALTAMLEYDRTLARRCYRLALHYDPLNLKTYVRLGWTYLPTRFARSISAKLPLRIQRAVEGPAQA